MESPVSIDSASFQVTRKSFPPPDGLPSAAMPLGIPGFCFADLFVPERLKDLFDAFCTDLAQRSPEVWRDYDAYRSSQGVGMKPEEVSRAIVMTAPFVSAFVGRLFGVEEAMQRLASEVSDRSPLWRFKAEFAKKRVLKEGAGKTWKGGEEEGMSQRENEQRRTAPDAGRKR